MHAVSEWLGVIMQLSLRCSEVAPGVRPSVEGEDGADWCVVDAGDHLTAILPCAYAASPTIIACLAHYLQCPVACCPVCLPVAYTSESCQRINCCKHIFIFCAVSVDIALPESTS